MATASNPQESAVRSKVSYGGLLAHSCLADPSNNFNSRDRKLFASVFEEVSIGLRKKPRHVIDVRMAVNISQLEES